MSMVEVKTAELIGYALDWAVGVACKESEPRLYQDIRGFWLVGPFGKPWNPSADWSQGGPLIEKYKVGISYVATDAAEPRYPLAWCAWLDDDTTERFGCSPMVAACRAIVISHFGDTVQVPEELASTRELPGANSP